MRDGHASLTSDLFKEPHRASFELLLLPDKYDFPNLVVTVERFLDLKDRGENSLVVHAVVKAVELDLLVESLQPLPLESPLLKNLASSCLRVLDAKRGYADVIPVRALMKASDQLALAAMRLMLSSSYYDNFGERIGDKNGYRVQGSREAR